MAVRHGYTPWPCPESRSLGYRSQSGVAGDATVALDALGQPRPATTRSRLVPRSPGGK